MKKTKKKVETKKYFFKNMLNLKYRIEYFGFLKYEILDEMQFN
jgi:hypothetical protein